MTAQIADLLTWKGKKHKVMSDLPLPEDDSRIVEKGDCDEVVDLVFCSSACWRGYRALWKIRYGKLYLVGLEGRLKLVSTTPILADWFSGVIRTARGDLLEYVHMGYASTYEDESLIEIKEGVVAVSSVFDSKERD